ncbi:hypothetical protein PanWU01x14_165140 [Parasponia andersonii]|uniref:Uncharacterized protein n=1 Tax=Parasponia andersonii TaxID=3476 RepID=A0A2P5CCB0_PARAD|nr:hypothetical protein PanWU01x14_165140 [Parasponia andersonii]
MAKSKTQDGTPPSLKGKEKVDTSKKRKVVFEDIPTSSPPPKSPLTTSQSEPPKETVTSDEGASQVDKDKKLFAFLRQLLEKAGMSTAFIDRFTSNDGWERMRRRPVKVAFSSAMRMLANVSILYLHSSTYFSGIDVLYF